MNLFILSSQNQLEATTAGHVVGTRTILDVLQAVSSLSESKQNWAKDRYDYLINLITLKKNAGTLSSKDLVQINAWLSNSVTFDLNTPVKAQLRKNVAVAAINPKTLNTSDHAVLAADDDTAPSSKDKVASKTVSAPPTAVPST